MARPNQITMPQRRWIDQLKKRLTIVKRRAIYKLLLLSIFLFETTPIGKFQLKSYSQTLLWMNLHKVSRTKD